MTESTETKQEQPRSESGCGAGTAFSRLSNIFQPPAGAGDHFRQARIEFLKGVRGLVDHQIERLTHGPAKGTRITVE